MYIKNFNQLLNSANNYFQFRKIQEEAYINSCKQVDKHELINQSPLLNLQGGKFEQNFDNITERTNNNYIQKLTREISKHTRETNWLKQATTVFLE